MTDTGEVRRKRSAQVTFPAAIFAAAMFSVGGGCTKTPPPNAYTAVCVEETSGRRVADDQCPDGDEGGHSGFVYLYYPPTHPVPAVGAATHAGAVRALPPGAVVVKAPPGGAAARGGFGGRGGAGGGG